MLHPAPAARSLTRHPEHRAGRPHAVCGPHGGLAASRREVENAHARAERREVEHPLAERGGQTLLDAVIPSPNLLRREERRAGDAHGAGSSSAIAAASSVATEGRRGMFTRTPAFCSEAKP